MISKFKNNFFVFLFLLYFIVPIYSCVSKDDVNQKKVSKNKSNVIDSTEVFKLESDLNYGTPEACEKAMVKLTSYESQLISDVLGKFVKNNFKKCDQLDKLKLVQDVIYYFSFKERPYSSDIFNSIALILEKKKENGKWISDNSAPSYYNKIPIEVLIGYLLNIHTKDSDDVMVFTAIKHEDYNFQGKGRFYEDDFEQTERIIREILNSGQQARTDTLMLRILKGYAAFKNNCPMNEAAKYISNRKIPEGEEVIESIIQDAFSINPLYEYITIKGHWQLRAMSSHYSKYNCMMPLLWALAEYNNPNVVYYAKKLMDEEKATDELALLFSACGDRTLRHKVLELLRSGSTDNRKRAAFCIFKGKNFSKEDLDILKYISSNDPDPNVKKYVSQELDKLTVTNIPNGDPQKILMDKAYALIRIYEHAKAIEVFSEIIYKYPENDLAMFSLADAYLYLNNFEKAIQTYKDIVNKFPNSIYAPRASFQIGYIYSNHLKNIEKARMAFNEFLKKYPNHELVGSAEWELKFLGRDINDVEFKKK